MSKKSQSRRSALIRQLHRHYRSDDAGLSGVCVYCGARADSVDHVPPLSLAIDLQPEYLITLNPSLFPACRNCNSVLGNSSELKLVDRRDIVAGYLSKKKRQMARGREIYEKKLPAHEVRDLACLSIFERWLFASVTQNEAQAKEEDLDEIEDEIEDEYSHRPRRKREKKRKEPELGFSAEIKIKDRGVPTEREFTVSALANVSPQLIQDADLKNKSVVGFVNLSNSEIDFCLHALREHTIGDARKKCVERFRPFILNANQLRFFQEDDGTRFFLAVLFSLNCSAKNKFLLLDQLKRSG